MYKISVPVLRQYAVIISVNLVTICVGMDLGWTSPVLVKLRDPKQSPLPRPITEDEGGWIVSIGYIFCVFLLPFIGMLLNFIGRRYTLLITSLLKIVAGGMTILANELWILLVARVIHGITTTAAFTVVMIYTTEISSKEIRGSLGSLLAISSNLGVFIMLVVGPYVSYLNVCIIVTAASICASIPLLFIPDTPYWLYNKGRIEEAKKVLKFFRGSKSLADEELKELSQTASTQKANIRELMKNKVYLKTFGIVFILSLGVQLVGFNFISMYLQTILEISNTTVSPALGSGIIGIIQITSSILACVFIDRFGRKPILVSTLFALAAGMIGLAIFFLVKQHGVISGLLNYLPLICIAITTCSFSGGIGCLFFVMASEIADGPIRAITVTGGGMITFLMAFLLGRYGMNSLSEIGPPATFFVFGVLNVLLSLFIIFFVPETKQKTIAEIQRALGAEVADDENKDYTTRF